MENLGTEIGQKMRSAVKAKLLELGTGTATGYIDDELPDYVMIMVANKRSRQQMIDDLNLFLGTQTEVFVNWLHQVLQKLQEVTLPAQKVSKRKNSESTDANTAKKDKKEKKKDKKAKRGQKENSPVPGIVPPETASVLKDVPLPPNSPQLSIAAMPNDTSKAAIIPEEKSVENNEETLQNESAADDFDIPTISEIAENAVVQIRQQKELTELEELQQRIYLAKQQLKTMYTDESEDEDFLNIKANDEELEHIDETTKSRKEKDESMTKKSKRVAITANNTSKTSKSNDVDGASSPTAKKKSILDRLGVRPSLPVNNSNNETPNQAVGNIISLSAHRRVEKQIYVPVFRRNEEKSLNSSKPKERVRASSRDRDRTRVPTVNDRYRKERQRDRERNDVRSRFVEVDSGKSRHSDRKDKDKSNSKSATNNNSEVRSRIGSRVIVMPLKPEYVEEDLEVPVNSVVKIKPRPQIPKNKQASKNLLLRAVAEAQKSTANAKIKELSKTINNHHVESKIPSPNLVFKTANKNILIEIAGIQRAEDETAEEARSEEDGSVNEEVDNILNNYEDEYIPEPIVSESEGSDSADEEYIEESQTIGSNANNEQYGPVEFNKKTNFVVTLDGAYKAKKKGGKSNSPDKTPPPPPANSKSSVKNRIGYKKSQVSHTPSPPSSPPPPKNIESGEHLEMLKKRKERFSIKNIAASKRPEDETPTAHTDEEKNRESKPKTPEKREREKKTQEKRVRKTPEKVEDIVLAKSDMKSAIPDEEEQKSPEKREKKVRKKSPSSINLNEILVKRTKELIDESVSSSPIYMSKSDYERMEKSSSSTVSRKRTRVSPIQFDLTDEEGKNSDEEEHHDDGHSRRQHEDKKDRSSDKKKSDSTHKSPRKIKKLESSRKFDDVPPLLSAISLPSDSSKVKASMKDRCKYYPTCRQGESCEFLHPTTPCKSFPNCKFGDKCLYMHPKCKYDKTCARLACNYTHTLSTLPSMNNSGSSAPPLASSVVPVQNYKSISATPLPALCKFYPNCSNTLCAFYHPKMCFFGKHCANKIECNFYHQDLPSKDKLKWVSPFSA